MDKDDNKVDNECIELSISIPQVLAEVKMNKYV